MKHRRLAGVTGTVALIIAGVPAVGNTLSGGALARAAQGNKPSYGPDLSATGRFVVFASDATNLVTGDSNGKRDIFIRDLQSRTTRLVSRGVAGKPANGASTSPTVSDDGRYVAFASSATNLVSGDTNGKSDVFRADLSTGKIVRVSIANGGGQANGVSTTPKISGNGMSIAFLSTATNLAPRDTNGLGDVFLRDLAASSTRRVSLEPTGDQLSWAAASDVTISNDGATIGFLGQTTLHKRAVFQWSRATGKTRFVAEDGYWTDVSQPRAANATVSWMTDEYQPAGYTTTTIDVRASPSSESFTVYNDGCNGYVGPYDVSRRGASAVVSIDHGCDEKWDLLILDEDYDSTGWNGQPPRAILTTDAGAPAMSADGSRVAFTTKTGQVNVWTWSTGAVTTASTS